MHLSEEECPVGKVTVLSADDAHSIVQKSEAEECHAFDEEIFCLTIQAKDEDQDDGDQKHKEARLEWREFSLGHVVQHEVERCIGDNSVDKDD